MPLMNIAFALPPLLVNPGSNEGQKARSVIRRYVGQLRKIGPLSCAKMRPEGVVFGIDGAFHPHASKTANAKALRALLDCLIDLNLICLDVCPNMPDLYETPVVYHLMPHQAAWDTIPTLYRRGYSDCKSLVAARVAWLRRRGYTVMPVFRNVTDGWGTMFHILMLHGDGRWECPSRAKGMKTVQEMPVQYSTA